MISDNAWLVKFWQRPVVWLSGLGLAVTLPILSVFAIKGFYVRYVADDFCTAASLGDGWLQAQIHWYTTWSGRFSFTAVVTALEWLSSSMTQALPAITLVGWMAVLAWALRLALYRVGVILHWVTALFLSSLVLVIFVLTSPHPGQVFYWFTGNITYTLPLLLLTLMAGLAMKAGMSISSYRGNVWSYMRSPEVLWSFGVGLLAFISASLNETYAVFQLALLGLLLVLVVLHQLEHKRFQALSLVMVVMWLGLSLLSTLIMYLAPGNAIRKLSFPVNPTIEDTIEYAFNATNTYLVDHWQYALYVVLFMLGVGLFTLSMQPLKTARSTSLMSTVYQAVTVIFVVYLLCVLVQAPSYYVQHYPTELRSLASIPLTLSIGVLVTSYLVARILVDWLPAGRGWLKLVMIGWVGLMIGYISVSQTSYLWGELNQELPEMQAYVEAWDRQSDALAHQGQSHVSQMTVKQLGRTFGLEDTSVDGAHWINQCMADYYNIGQIVAQ